MFAQNISKVGCNLGTVGGPTDLKVLMGQFDEPTAIVPKDLSVGVVSMKIHEDKCNEEQVSLVCNTILLGENPGSV